MRFPVFALVTNYCSKLLYSRKGSIEIQVASKLIINMQFRQSSDSFQAVIFIAGGATAGKTPKVWALPRFWVSICSYKKQPVKNIWGRILGLAWLKFAVAPLVVYQ